MPANNFVSGTVKRIWTQTHVRPTDAGDGFLIMLDNRPVTTPAMKDLVTPTRALAEIVAAEWAAEGPDITPDQLMATRICNAAIDRTDSVREEVTAAMLEYAESDLLCYRDPGENLCRRQAQSWDPVLDWAERALSAPLKVTRGVIPVTQPSGSLAALRRQIESRDVFLLLALQHLVTPLGSLLLALAVFHGFLSPDTAWRASNLDEDWQAESWGVDPEAAARAKARESDFMLAVRILRALMPVGRQCGNRTADRVSTIRAGGLRHRNVRVL
ncbi:MAG: ATPase [Paracoccaceae bacterium]|nr:ATPase [Paracoccaceae bacterium]MDE2913762.1 ATPase [Paracoccaceae bacterium]